MAVPIRPSKLHRRQFQALTAECFDRQAAAISQIGNDLEALKAKAQAQGEVIADLCVARDTYAEGLKAVAVHATCAYVITNQRGLWGRLRWLVSGK